jgi:hypothetical protein
MPPTSQDGDAERAATLLGAAATLRGGTLASDRDAASVAEAAEHLLGAEQYAAAHRRGAGLTREEVLDLAGE